MNVSLRQENSPTCHTLYLGPLTLVFSYSTVIAYAYPGEGWVVSENVWSKTTGKHLNQSTPRHAKRIPYDEFETRLNRVLDLIEVREVVA